MDRRRVAACAAVAAVGLLSGCSAAAEGDKSGGPADRVELVLANNDASLDGVPALAWFVERVDELSDGRLTIKVESPWRGGNKETRVIRDVAAGQADLGWAGTRAFDLVGVDAFRPLHAPFLISSYAAEVAVVGDDDLAGSLMASVEPLGVTGLALAADQLRHPAGVDKPLLTPEDYVGRRIFSIASDAQSDGLATLGAEAFDGSVRLAAANGRLGGMETMWWSYRTHGYTEFAPFITSNVTLWPRTWVLFADDDTLEDLEDEQRRLLGQAANEAAAWSLEHAADAEPGQIAQACLFGAKVATATAEQVAALREAAEPVYADLRADPALRDTLERIEGLVAAAPSDLPVVLPEGCAHQPGQETPLPERTLAEPGDPGKFPTGVYRYRHTVADLTAHGMDEYGASLNAGVWTWTLGEGTWSYEQEPVTEEAVELGITDCEGFYDVRDDVAFFTTTAVFANGDCAPPTWAARWTAGDGRLTWSAVSAPDFGYPFAPRPWQQID
jgi:TRAP-type C4-dicarboxylate transport system substrate-binding protein